MTSKALPVIEEFVRSGVPQQRMNALAALIVLGDVKSACMIARMALNDEDEGVRQRALKEIARLDKRGVRVASLLFRRMMVTGGKVEQERAYAAVGYLRSLGADVPRPGLPASHLFRLAAAMKKHLYPHKSLEFRLRVWKPALLGGLAGGLFLSLVAAWPMRRFEFITGWERLLYTLIAVLLMIAGGTVTAVSATQRSSPSSGHIDRRVGTAVEVLASSCTGFLGILAFYAVFSSLTPFPLEKNVATIGLLVLCGVMVGVVRAATTLTFGFYRQRRWNWAAQVLMGTSAGFWVVTMIILAVVLPNDPFYPAEVFFFMVSSIPFAAACACAFTSIDNTYPLAAARRGIIGNMSRALLVALILFADLFLFFVVAVRVST